jgi:D-beta-D-heptose 7-phosphate kinase/D-beta-D-heptose 1-phosphate adenosyltransferase
VSDSAALVALVGNLRDACVLCVGDVMLDRYVYGEVSRISPEAPVPVCRVTDETAMLGGAGNVVRNLVALGARAEFVTAVGSDTPGDEVRALVDKIDGVHAEIVIAADRPTTIKTRYITANQQLFRADHEADTPIPAGVEKEILDKATAALSRAGALVLSDYGKGVLGTALTAALIAAANKAGCPVIVDPKGDDYTCYRGATVVTPNRRELAGASRMETATDAEIESAAKHIAESCGIASVLVTRGGDGMTFLAADGTGTHHLPAEAREVFDVSGAGDTVVAAMAAGLAAGIDVGDAIRIANVAAGIVVGKAGTAVAYGADVAVAIRSQDLATPGADKVAALEPALDRIKAWRRLGNRIGFTNGCFDLVHPGHLALLSKSRAACDRLVVGLNSDISAHRLKGDGRPVQTEAARAAVLASLACVDLVVIFGDDTPYELIRAIRPDILAKGADYKIEDVVGADIVGEYGGEVMLVDLEPGHSTTATIARLAR